MIRVLKDKFIFSLLGCRLFFYVIPLTVSHLTCRYWKETIPINYCTLHPNVYISSLILRSLFPWAVFQKSSYKSTLITFFEVRVHLHLFIFRRCPTFFDLGLPHFHVQVILIGLVVWIVVEECAIKKTIKLWKNHPRSHHWSVLLPKDWQIILLDYPRRRRSYNLCTAHWLYKYTHAYTYKLIRIHRRADD